MRKKFTVRVKLRGTAPVLMNPMLSAKVEEIGGKKAAAPQRNDQTDRVVAATKVYRNGKGQMGWPGINLGASLCEAGKHISIKLGSARKASALTKSGGKSQVPTLVVLKPFYPFDNLDGEGEIPWEANVAPTRNPQTGGRNRTVRPIINEWECTIEHDFYDDILPETMLDLWKFGGEKAGLGDGRPSAPDKPLPIPHGTYEVVSFEIIDVVEIKDNVTISYTAGAEAKLAMLGNSGNGNGKPKAEKNGKAAEPEAEPVPTNRLAGVTS